MKNKGVMISLAAIMLIGIIITKSTYNFIEKNSTDSDMEVRIGAEADETEAKETETGEVLAEAAPLMAAAMDGGEPAAAAGEEEGSVLEEDQDVAGEAASFENKESLMSEQKRSLTDDMLPETESVMIYGENEEETLISPLDTMAEEKVFLEAEEKNVSVEDTAKTQSYYVKRLQDLDSQIQKNRETQSRVNNGNNSARSAASNELKLWDSELNSIYNAILEKLDQEQSEELVKEERAWLKERDSLAMEAAKTLAGGSDESTEYTISLMESTRQRAYELAERYAQVLE